MSEGSKLFSFLFLSFFNRQECKSVLVLNYGDDHLSSSSEMYN